MSGGLAGGVFPASGSCEFSYVLEAVGTPPFLCSLAVFGGAGKACLTELFFGKQSQRASWGANMGILRRIVRIN